MSARHHSVVTNRQNVITQWLRRHHSVMTGSALTSGFVLVPLDSSHRGNAHPEGAPLRCPVYGGTPSPRRHDPREAFNAAPLDLLDAGRTPPCADDRRFMSDDPAERAAVASWRVRCPLTRSCVAMAGEERPSWGVWSGTDYSPRTRPAARRPRPTHRRHPPMPDHKPAHRPGCARPEPVESRSRGGSRLLTCPGCQRFWFPDTVPQPNAHRVPLARTGLTPSLSGVFTPDEPVNATDTATATTSRYVCRDHYAPVRPNGRGCTDCARERAAS